MSAWSTLRAQAVVAIAGLATAVWATQDAAPSAPQGELPIVDCDVHAVELHTPERDVTVEGREDGVRVEVVRRRRGETTTRRFRGGERAEAYLEGLRPLLARRSLGELEEEALREVGLDPASLSEHQSRWTLRCDDGARTFDVGGAAYGTGDRYIRSVEGGPVYLIAAGRLRTLETAELQLRQHRLHRFDPRDVATVRLQAPLELELEQRGRRSPTSAWVDRQDPTRRRRDLDRLMRAVLQLAVSGEETTPPPDASVVLRLSLLSVDGDELGHLEVRTWGNGAERRYCARSESSGGWVAVLPSAGAALSRALERVRGSRSDAGPAAP